MSTLVWDESGKHLYETGIRKGVLYPLTSGEYAPGVVWNGLTGVTESPSGAESNPMYADDIKYLDLTSAEEFGGTIEAYMYPDEFGRCDGTSAPVVGISLSQQKRSTFGLCYRTILGNDEDGEDHGYKLHFVWGAKAAPSEKSYQTVNDSPEAVTLSWEFTTTPVQVTGFKPSSHMTIDSSKSDATKLKSLEDILYGVPAIEFSSESTYKVGDYVTYGVSSSKKTYKCKVEVSSAGAWSDTNWDEVAKPGPRLPLPDEIITLMTPEG